jgi:hypothetical protein
MEVWGKTWNRAVFFGAGGGSGCSPSAFPIGPPFCLFTRVVELQCSRPRSLSCWGSEVGNTEAERRERVSAGSRGDRDGNAAHSARTRGHGACAASARVLYGTCVGLGA